MKKSLPNLLLIPLSLVFAISIAETAARFIGYEAAVNKNGNSIPALHQFDTDLGWKNRPGHYSIEPFHPAGQKIDITFFSNGMRKTYRDQNSKDDYRPKIVFIGGSCTQGWAISNHETYPWKVQKAFPSYEILNCGTGGYGTYQSLLMLERVLPEIKNPRIVVYGFIRHHEIRNVAPAKWIESLSMLSKSGVDIPYATLDTNHRLCRHKPIHFPSWPLSEKISIISMAEKSYLRVTSRGRERQARKVTRKLLLEMSRLCKAHQTEFAIVFLRTPGESRTDYMNFSRENGIQVIDCNYPVTEDMRVKGDGHPNGLFNSKWAACISTYLQNRYPDNP